MKNESNYHLCSIKHQHYRSPSLKDCCNADCSTSKKPNLLQVIKATNDIAR
ncbi:hypothetical protein UMNF18_2485 [Escherichia coli UMNF18]|nr:hypothetical protein UMNF18_1373 [Escherichia coli UMNF18]AEJ57055.1 hypothetical protein UMNF18_2485 [Escherichia coli UMNF18]